MYVSIDIETTGIDPHNCDVIEFGAVIDNIFIAGNNYQNDVDKLPVFHRYIVKDFYRGDPFALAMHQKIFERIAKRDGNYDYLTADVLDDAFYNWLVTNGYHSKNEQVEIVVAGKNFAKFDLRFLELLPNFGNRVKFNRRIVDVGSMYFNPHVMSEPPSLDYCLSRCPGVFKKVEHNAVSDARDVIRCIRNRWDKKF